MLRNPKPGFEEVIKLHFRHRKVPLLKTLHGWVEEVPPHLQQYQCNMCFVSFSKGHVSILIACAGDEQEWSHNRP